MGVGTGFTRRTWECTDVATAIGIHRVCLFGESPVLAVVPMGPVAKAGDTALMPCQTRLNLYATFVALLGFVILAFNHA